MHQQNPANSTLVYSTCGSTAQCRKKCALIFFTLMFLLVGFILIIVGISAKRSWGPEDELRSSFCKEERMATEQNLKNCRIVGPIFLAIGFFFLSATIIVLTSKPRENRAEYVIGRPNTGQIGSATHGGSGNVTTTTQHPSRDGIQQLYGHSEYPSGSGSYPSQPAGHVTYPKEAAYPSSFRYSYNSSQNGRQAPCLTATPPHPSFESFVGQRNVAASAPPPGDAGVLKEMKEFAACFPCFVVYYNAKACDKRGFLR